MRPKAKARCLAPIAAVLALAACQGVDAGAEGNSIGAMRLASTQPVASAQRLDDEGYPLLGAFPRAAAPQLSDAQVSQSDMQLNAVASRQTGTSDARQYNARIASLEEARRRQAAEIAERQASQPAARSTPGGGPRPEDVLSEIEASG